MIFLFAALSFLLFDRGIAFVLQLAEKNFYATGRSVTMTNAPKGYYDALVMGTSRTREGLLPIHLHRFLGVRAFSTASMGCYPRYHYLAYRRFREENGPPRYIFYGMDYFTFDKETGPSHLAAMGVDVQATPSSEPPPRGLGRISILARRKPRNDRLFVDLINRVGMQLETGGVQDITPAGVSTYSGLNGRVPPGIQAEPPSWKKAPFTPYPGKEGAYLVKLLEEARRDRVRVFLVYLPDYINVYRTNFMQAEFLIQVSKLADRYPRVHFLDFNRPEIFPLEDPAMFVDGRYGSRISHLSALGALRFNRMLAEEVRRRLRRAPGLNR